MHKLDYRAGDWVVWSDFHDGESDYFRRISGEGPFLVKEVVESTGNIMLIKEHHKISSHFSGRRFKYVNRFLLAVEEALERHDIGETKRA